MAKRKTSKNKLLKLKTNGDMNSLPNTIKKSNTIPTLCFLCHTMVAQNKVSAAVISFFSYNFS